MNVRFLLKSELAGSRSVLAAITLVLALSLALAVAVISSERMIRSSSARAADDFDILVGAKGSPSALLLSTVFLRDEAVSPVPATVLNELGPDSGAVWAAPMAFGDRVKNAPLVGTVRDFVTMGGKRDVARGRIFEKKNEIVAGARSGLAIGDEIEPMHGRIAGLGHAHGGHALRVVGILPETGTPWDRAALAPIETLWSMHGAEAADHHAGNEKPLEYWMEGDLSGLPGFSAVIVKAVRLSDAYRLRNRISGAAAVDRDGRQVNLMAVFSGEVLVDLYRTMGGAAQLLGAVTRATLAITLAGVVICGLLLARLRLPTLLKLRTMGAPRAYVVSLIWLLVMTVVAAGTLLGLAMGYGLAGILAAVLTSETGIAMHAAIGSRELIFCAATLGAGAVCALVPAIAAGSARLS